MNEARDYDPFIAGRATNPGGPSIGQISLGYDNVKKGEARRYICTGRQLLSIAAEEYLPYRDQIQRRRGKL